MAIGSNGHSRKRKWQSWDYIRREFTIKAGEPLKVKLAPGGGFAARLCRAK